MTDTPVNPQHTLHAAGYQCDPESQVWCSPGFGSIDYSDGDGAENQLLETLRGARDVSVFSSELAAACRDWPSRYHLSTERANLLRPFATSLVPGAQVLEIGAGCGAVTRYLGETGAAVLALEGSWRRATIARERTRDLQNVQVLAERFQDLKLVERFDVVTLIGVLEYASLFSDSDNPAVDMLQRVRRLLKPGGRLILAIENKLGLKYLAGVPEDHLGTPMVGVENRYAEKGPRTYGRVELDDLLVQAGFAGREFLVPLPDYKMPATVLSGRGLAAPRQRFDIAPLLSQAVRRDPQLTPTTFNLQRAWPEVSSNGLALDLANSFLVEATSESIAAQTPAVLAWHFSTQRAGRFARQTCFVDEPQGVRVESMALADDTTDDAGGVKLVVSGPSDYLQGNLVVDEWRALLTTPGWRMEQMVFLVADYVQALRTLLEQQGAAAGPQWPAAADVLPDDFIDATPSNLMRSGTGEITYFDREWSVPAPTLGWLLTRALLFTYGGTPVAPMDADAPARSVREWLVQLISQTLNDPAGAAVVDAAMLDEFHFQLQATGKDQQEALQGMLDAHVPRLSTAAAPAQPSTDVLVKLDGLQHSFNLSSQHMINMYASLAALHDVVGNMQAGLNPAVQSINAQVQHVSAGQQALHARLVATDDRAEDSLRHWSAEHRALADDLIGSIQDERRQQLMTGLQQTVESLVHSQNELRDAVQLLMGNRKRTWWGGRR
ncbi:class I SAM-dependent methyltransferase [Stenotrophomonas indicatrix]|uniref:class I SAM-dependent methyltransferase n=1 Tax=Stenotrophomonas indicatrix TaxID=2045451 RepID=UPI0028A93E13|nr:class I SAM-dependent methyltransferase [Stenotrophomonas indicatrix]